MAHGLLVRLVDEVPDVDLTVIAADDDDTGPKGREPPAGDHAILVVVALEDRDGHALLPDAKAEVVDRQDDVLEEHRAVQPHGLSVVLSESVEIDHGVGTVYVLVRPHGPVHDKHLAVIACARDLRLKRVLLKTQLKARHLASALGSEQLHAVVCLPGDLLIRIALGFLCYSNTFSLKRVSQNKIWPPSEKLTN